VSHAAASRGSRGTPTPRSCSSPGAAGEWAMCLGGRSRHAPAGAGGLAMRRRSGCGPGGVMRRRRQHDAPPMLELTARPPDECRGAAPRCGEWAHAFLLLLRAAGLDARHVHDHADHVSWAERRGVPCRCGGRALLLQRGCSDSGSSRGETGPCVPTLAAPWACMSQGSHQCPGSAPLSLPRPDPLPADPSSGVGRVFFGAPGPLGARRLVRSRL
jgi:hypothetical protein